MPLDPDRVEAYLRGHVTGETPAMVRLRQTYEREGLPNVEPEVGNLLEVLARSVGAKRVLEVGCCLGYSALWFARAVGPDGLVETIEHEPDYVTRACANFEAAGVSDVVRVHRGEALDILLSLEGPYDVVFIDADKREYVDYLDQAVRLVRPRGLIVADNVLWGGRVLEEDPPDDDTNAIRRFTKALTTNTALHTTILPIGDGISVTVVGS